MIRKFIPYLLPLFILGGFIVSNIYPKLLLYVAGVLVILALIFFKYISRRDFRKSWNNWLNYLLFLLSSFMQLYIIESPPLRILYIVLLTVVWFWITYAFVSYFRDGGFRTKQYLEINRFLYFLTFWQIANIIYFSLIFINITFWLAILVFVLTTLAIISGLINVDGLKKSSKSLVLMAGGLTSVELSAVITLLPIHFYIQSSLATLWFFFIMELTLQGQDLSSRKRLFWRYLLFFCLTAIILLLTSYT